MKTAEIRTPFDAPVFYKEETDSTMLEMARLDDPVHGTVIMTGYQTSGKGRGQNRTWKSEKNKNLLFTISLNPLLIGHPMVRVPLICGLALNRYLLSELHLESKLKWPNDLLINNKKISGILCEYRRGFINAGIGINCLITDFDEEIKYKATSLKLQGVSDPAPSRILEGFLPYLKESLEESEWKEYAEMILYGMDRKIEILEGPAESQIKKLVRITGLNEEGMLTVEDLNTGIKRVLPAGEISFPEFK